MPLKKINKTHEIRFENHNFMRYFFHDLNF